MGKGKQKTRNIVIRNFKRRALSEINRKKHGKQLAIKEMCSSKINRDNKGSTSMSLMALLIPSLIALKNRKRVYAK